jgi:hypothetical protein
MIVGNYFKRCVIKAPFHSDLMKYFRSNSIYYHEAILASKVIDLIAKRTPNDTNNIIKHDQGKFIDQYVEYE